MKAAFIYVGPIGDYGWSHAHDQGRLYVESKFPWLETAYSESVAEGDALRYLDRYIDEGYDIVFTTSFGFMDDTVAAAGKYPDKIFWHCSGYERRANMGTYFSEFHQLYYLNGLMAGALTKTDKVGYIGAYPIPEVVRHIDAFALAFRRSVINQPSYQQMKALSGAVMSTLGKAVDSGGTVVLVFEADIGMGMGRVIREEIAPECNLVSIDEIVLHNFNFIDIGEPTGDRGFIPVVIKSLVFPNRI